MTGSKQLNTIRFEKFHPDAKLKHMPTDVGWGEISLRLLLTVIAGAIIGWDRGEHGRPAGLRTTMLVCLAASISMIQMNLLLPVSGRNPASFSVMDVMRLPLGILTGVGFIGAGAILRKDNLVLGVTTAATLWFVTIIGLCFGGGQLALGTVATVLGFIVLAVLRPIEKTKRQERQASLTVQVGSNGPSEQDITKTVVSAGYGISSLSITYDAAQAIREMQYRVHWEALPEEIQPPSFVADLAARQSTFKVIWQP